MPLVERCVDALAPAADLGELALVLACTTIVVVRGQVHALVVAASGVVAIALKVANLFIFVAMVSCSRVPSLLLKETAHPFGRHWQGLVMVSLWDYG
ncbi:hypothetical protein PTKIN_Ptkin14bG0039200 [Pterospermum kingtungense]